MLSTSQRPSAVKARRQLCCTQLALLDSLIDGNAKSKIAVDVFQVLITFLSLIAFSTTREWGQSLVNDLDGLVSLRLDLGQVLRRPSRLLWSDRTVMLSALRRKTAHIECLRRRWVHLSRISAQTTIW